MTTTVLDRAADPTTNDVASIERAPRPASHRWRNRLLALAPAAVLSVVYGLTLQRSTGNAFSWDTTKFGYLGQVLGTAHPPGYPLYTVLNAAAVRLVPIGEVALRANLLSAVCAVLACVAAGDVLRRLGVKPLLAAGGATGLGLVLPVWRYAVVAEVYTLTALFTLAVLAGLLRYEAFGRRGWLRFAYLAFALSFAHTTSSVLLIPGLLFYLAARRPVWLLRAREWATLLPAGAALALLPYAYLPWRTAAGGSTYLDSRATDWESLWQVMTGARFSGSMFAVPLQEVQAQRLPELGAAAVAAYGPLLVLAAIGMLVLLVQRVAVGGMLALWAIATLVFVLGYAVADWQTMLLPVWILVGLWAVVGLDRCVGRLGRVAPVVGLVVALALPAAGIATGYTSADRSRDNSQAEVDAALALVPDHSIVFTPSSESRHQFNYRLLPDGEGRRRDVWVSRGSGTARSADRPVVGIRAYCAPRPGPWVWPAQERSVAPSVRRGLNTYVYGHGYARRLRSYELDVQQVDGNLYRLTCPGGQAGR